jgi:hypothetical protein
MGGSLLFLILILLLISSDSQPGILWGIKIKTAVAEDHPLVIRGRWKKPLTVRADAVLAIGFRFWSGEKFGEAPTRSKSARYIQADATPTRIGLNMPAEVARLVTRNWFTALSVFVLLEKVIPRGLLVARTAGVVLVGCGGRLALSGRA